jgi:tryptophanyl-tRNA synthetase
LLKGPRAELEKIRVEKGYLQKVAADGAEKARRLSERTMQEVRKRIGLPKAESYRIDGG